MAEGSAAAVKKNVERSRELEARMGGYQTEIANEKQRCAELDKLILQANRELREARRSSTSTNSTGNSTDTSAVQRRIQMMENRVEKANRKLNTMLVANAKLRDNVEHLRQERHVFDSIHKKLEKQLHQQKREMATSIERSNQVGQRGFAAKASCRV